MVCYYASKRSKSCAKGYCLLDSFLMVPEKQFGFKTTDVTSGVRCLLLDSVMLVISLQQKNFKMINLNIYLFISYLIVSVKLNCFS